MPDWSRRQREADTPASLLYSSAFRRAGRLCGRLRSCPKHPDHYGDHYPWLSLLFFSARRHGRNRLRPKRRKPCCRLRFVYKGSLVTRRLAPRWTGSAPGRTATSGSSNAATRHTALRARPTWRQRSNRCRERMTFAQGRSRRISAASPRQRVQMAKPPRSPRVMQMVGTLRFARLPSPPTPRQERRACNQSE